MRLIFLICSINLTLFGQSTGLYGTWEAFEKKESILFVLNKDGSGSFDGIAFSYKIQENELVATFDYGVFNYDYLLKDNQLTLKEGNLEHPYVFKKIKEEIVKTVVSLSKNIDPLLLGTWSNGSHKVVFNADGTMIADEKKQIYEAQGLKLKVFNGNQMEENPYSVYQNIISIALNGEIIQLKKEEQTLPVKK
ncbi:MAG: hypothetical protein H7329_16690 [Opitutaceae bacterium]|nr:hypothetical protein [Cytophagales bacterium]